MVRTTQPGGHSSTSGPPSTLASASWTSYLVATPATTWSPFGRPDRAQRGGRRPVAGGASPAHVRHDGPTELVPLTERNLCASAGRSPALSSSLAEDRCLAVMPLFHIHGLVASVLAPSRRLDRRLHTGIRPAPVRIVARGMRASWYTAVPTMDMAVLERARAEGGAPERAPPVRSSSAALPPLVGDALEDLFDAPVLEAYGMTEAAHRMAVNPFPPTSASGARSDGPGGRRSPCLTTRACFSRRARSARLPFAGRRLRGLRAKPRREPGVVHQRAGSARRPGLSRRRRLSLPARTPQGDHQPRRPEGLAAGGGGGAARERSRRGRSGLRAAACAARRNRLGGRGPRNGSPG